jgi:hypothetical protein
MAEVINISLDNLDDNKPLKSVNFGGGVEMLMNDKKKSTTPTNDNSIELSELENLEAELNESAGISKKEAINNVFSLPSFTNTTYNDEPKLNLGNATKNEENTETWDGYKKFNEVPVVPEISVSSEPQLSKEELLREKFKYLRKLEDIEKKGAQLSKKYTMESSLLEMKGEYETIVDEKKTANSIKFQGQMLVTAITGIEWLNGKFDPFDIKLDGWGESVQENMNDYDEIFAELHEKYKTKGKMAPELRLLFALGGSAAMIHMTNSMFKSSMPGMDDILKQNPDLMNQFTSAAANSMQQQNSGFGNFMSGLMNNVPSQDIPKQQYNTPSNVDYNNNRPDLRKAKQPDFTDSVDAQNNYGSVNDFKSTKRVNTRPEMKGPSDINDILSGLKTKSINIEQPELKITEVDNKDKGSTISISELTEMNTEMNKPNKSKRRQKSERNTVNLDL